MKQTGGIPIVLLGIILLLSCNSTSNDQREQQQEEETTAVSDTTQRILFFGNSLTAGYGLENPKEAFPSLIQQKIDSLGLPYTCVNAGLSGETSAGGKDRIDWVLREPVDIFVLELGANDGLRGIETEATRANLKEIVQKVNAAYPDADLVLAGMMVPPSMGQQYFDQFAAIFPRLAQEMDMVLVPFLLDKVAGVGDLNQSDGIHPTKQGQIIIAETVWEHLKPLL
ncbi:MAG: arylesterase [Sphingobacterium sp.]